MPTETNCERWLADVKIVSDDAVYSLYNTVLDEEGCGDFVCSNRGKELFVRPSNTEKWLKIASRRAKEDFLVLLSSKYCEGEDVHAWYERNGGSMSKTG